VQPHVSEVSSDGVVRLEGPEFEDGQPYSILQLSVAFIRKRRVKLPFCTFRALFFAIKKVDFQKVFSATSHFS